MNLVDVIIWTLSIALAISIVVSIYAFYILIKVMRETEENELLEPLPFSMLNIYEIIHEDGEKEWCTGATNIEALANYVSTTGCSLHEMDGAEIKELPKEKWSEYRVKEEGEGSDQSFQEWMDKFGKGAPEIICGTMYDF